MATELATFADLYTLSHYIILTLYSYTHLINLLKQPVPKYKEAFQPVLVNMKVPQSAFSSLWTMFKFLVSFSTSENHVHPYSHGFWTRCHQMVRPLICLHYKCHLRIWWLHRVQMVQIHFFNGLHRKSTQSVNTKQFCCNISPQVISTSYCPINNTSSQPFGLHTVNRQTDQVS